MKTEKKKRLPKSCFDYSIFLLSKRDYAVEEMRKKLIARGFDDVRVEETVARLEEGDYVNDARFAKLRVRYRADISRWGARRIQRELSEKGVPEYHISAAFEHWESGEESFGGAQNDWQENATSLLRKRFGPWPETLPPPNSEMDWDEKSDRLKAIEKEKTRRLHFLMRRGFTSEQAIYALEHV